MQVGWLIDGDMFDGYRDALVHAISEQGHIAKSVQPPSPPYRWEDVGCSYRETFPEDSCVVAHGDIELVTKIRDESRWTPGAFATVSNFYYSNYARHFGEFLLNRENLMLPFGDLEQQSDLLFDSFGREDRIFVRPDSPLKLFTGQTVSRDTFAADIEFMGFYGFPTNSPVVVSSPKEILGEWRFVVADSRVVAGSQYRSAAGWDVRPNVPPDARALAATIASSDFQPDPVWIIDICQTDDRCYHLLEIGGFSFSDLYACSMPDVVKAVSATALQVWNNRNR